MTKPTLVVLAAGMGSRYGSLKQMDGVGPNNEAIIDYSIYDAVQAGFGKVVFVIRHSFEQEFKEVFSKEHFRGKIDVEFVFQELDYLPEGFTVPDGRIKPWGTCHAVLMAAPAVNGPFAVINADDFYGRDAYMVLAEYLRKADGTTGNYSMVGYNLRNTLSDYGTVSRGECSVDQAGNLVAIVERTAIERGKDGIVRYKEQSGEHPIDENTTVSMNLFGFTPDFFEKTEELFKKFLSDPSNLSNIKSEFFIPLCVNTLIEEKRVTLKVLTSQAKWFGVTYKEDKPEVMDKISQLIANGTYPSKLW